MEVEWDVLCKAINAGDPKAGVDESLRLVESGVDPLSIFLEGIEPCMLDIGDRFSRLECFLPELMAAAKVVESIQENLLPLMGSGENIVSKGKVVIATIFGDVHDIGKNIVKTMLRVNGFEVKDLGVGVPATDLINAAKSFDADIIAISALMMPSLPFVKDAIELVKQNSMLVEQFTILVGGGPLTGDWAKQVGADGYADDAVGASQEAHRLVHLLRGE